MEDKNEIISELETIGQPTVRDLVVQAFQDAAKAIQLDPRLTPFGIGLEVALGMIPQQGMESLRSFVAELGEEVKHVQERVGELQLHVDRMETADYRAMIVKVMRAVQFETQEEKRKCYRAILINALTGDVPRHSVAQQEYLLKVLDGITVYAIWVLKILSDPKKARQEYERLQPRTSGGSVVFWDVLFFLSGQEAEMPTFESVLRDLDSKELLYLEPVCREPRGVLTTDLINAARTLTDFGKEFIKFVTLPEAPSATQ